MTDRDDKTAARKGADLDAAPTRTVRGAKIPIFLSWGGETYGPATPEEITDGLRTAWFEADTLYWHEGLPEWKPIAEFSQSSASNTPVQNWVERKVATAPHAPELPGRGKRRRRSRSKDGRGGKTNPRTSKAGLPGAAVIVGFAVLGVLLTIGIIMLLMLV